MVRQRPSGPRLNRLQSKLWECALALDPRHADARLDGGLRAALSASEAEESAAAFAALVDSLPGASPDAALPVHRLKNDGRNHPRAHEIVQDRPGSDRGKLFQIAHEHYAYNRGGLMHVP